MTHSWGWGLLCGLWCELSTKLAVDFLIGKLMISVASQRS